MATSILIIGGGFGGISAALALAKSGSDVAIRLLDPKTYFEYHAALYRFVAGGSVAETCIPYREIFAGMKNVEVLCDAAATCDLEKKIVTGTSGAQYRYDTLVVALGSEVTTFGIPGADRHAFGMKTAQEALRLKRHIEERCEEVMNIVIIGGGATGVELAGELGSFARRLQRSRGWKKAVAKIILVEAADRLLSNLPEHVSERARKRLEALGVEMRFGENITSEHAGGVTLKDQSIKTETVIWTAGMCGHRLLKIVSGLTLNQKGRVIVDQELHPAGHRDIFVIGDSAATTYSGMAQTALYDGKYVADVWACERAGTEPPLYRPAPPIYAIPIGRGWAISLVGKRMFSGHAGWTIRRLLDLKVFLKMLPALRALRAFLQR